MRTRKRLNGCVLIFAWSQTADYRSKDPSQHASLYLPPPRTARNGTAARDPSSILAYQGLHLAVAHLLDAQQLIVQLLEMPAVALAPNRRKDEVIHEQIRVRLLLLELLPGLRETVSNSDLLLLPPLRTRGFLALGQERLQRGGRVLDIDGAVLGLVGMLEHAGDGLADGWERGGAEEAVAAVVELDALALDVHDEADHDAPVEERAGADQGVGHAGGAGLLLERVLDGDLGLEGREGAGLGEGGVGPEFGGDEALDACFAGGLDEEELLVDDGGAEGGYEGVLTAEGGGQGVEGGVVDGLDGHGGG